MDIMNLIEYFLISNTAVYHHVCVFFHTRGLFRVKQFPCTSRACKSKCIYESQLNFH